MTGKVGILTTDEYKRLTAEELRDPNYEFRELDWGTGRVMTAGVAADKIRDEFEDRIWDLGNEIFERLQQIGAVPANAAGSDYDGMIKDVLDKLW